MIGRKTLLLFGRTVMTGLLNMLATAAVARLMGPEALGTIGYLIGVVGMLSFVSDLGYSQAYIRRISDQEEFARHTSTFALVKVFLALVLGLVVMVTPAVSQRLGHPLLADPAHLIPYYLIGLFYISSHLSTVFQRTFEARLEAAKLTLVGLGATFLSVAAQVLVAWRGWGLAALSAAVALEGVGALLIGLLLFRGYPLHRPSLSFLRDYTAYAWPQMVLIFITTLSSNVDRAILGNLGGTAEVGYYVGVFGVLSLSNEMVRAAMRLFFPRVSQDAARADIDSMRQRLKGALKYLLLIIVPAVASTVLLREPLVRIYLGKKFLPAASVASAFALSVIPSIISRPYRQVLFAVEQHRDLITVRMLGLAVLVAACGLFVPTSLFGMSAAGLGALGAALAIVLKETAECLCAIYLSARHVGISLWKGMLWFLLAGSLMVGVGLAALLPFPEPGLALQILATVLGLAVYLILLYTAGQLRRAEVSLLLDVLHPLEVWRYIRSELGTVEQQEDDAHERGAQGT
jgi:O-antigen/teichoic acid export membrane protein